METMDHRRKAVLFIRTCMDGYATDDPLATEYWKVTLEPNSHTVKESIEKMRK